MYRTTKKKLVKRVGITAVAALGAVGLGAAFASASPVAKSASHTSAGAHDSTTTPTGAMGQGCGVGGGGVVTALSSTSISLSDPLGTTTTYAITSSTTVTKDRVAATVADLAVGDEVHVVPTASGSTTAASIAIVEPSVMGKVTAVSGDTITISGSNGSSATVIVSSVTTYTKDGANASLTDVAVGSSIFAEGSFASSTDTSTLDATNVGIGVAGLGGFGHPGGPSPQGVANTTRPSARHTR
jgi:hypothetical protein